MGREREIERERLHRQRELGSRQWKNIQRRRKSGPKEHDEVQRKEISTSHRFLYFPSVLTLNCIFIPISMNERERERFLYNNGFKCL
jgi:hypothetical protein